MTLVGGKPCKPTHSMPLHKGHLLLRETEGNGAGGSVVRERKCTLCCRLNFGGTENLLIRKRSLLRLNQSQLNKQQSGAPAEKI